MKKFKISFCTVAMNRLHHIKNTLKTNINANKGYGNVEFVLLDYNSNDELENWVFANCKEFINKGLLKFYKTNIPTKFHRSHSRNMAFKLATGDIVCNLDADNYTGDDFASYINIRFNANDNIFLTPIDFHLTKTNHRASPDVLGRVVCFRTSFIKIKGFFEEMATHGFQDYDFANRLQMAGYNREIIENQTFLQAIKHDDKERIENEFINNNLYGIFRNFITPSMSELLFMYTNNSFEKGTIIDNSSIDSFDFWYSFNKRNFDYEFTLKETAWLSGNWAKKEGNMDYYDLSFNSGDHLTIFTVPEADSIHDCIANNKYKKITSQSLIMQLIVFNTQYTNRNKMLNNLKLGAFVVNKGEFGSGVVYKNFNNSVRIEV